MKWLAEAPSNIALIKYMGKRMGENNVPCNSSLSYTLTQLNSFVELEPHASKEDIWEPLTLPGVDDLFSLTAAEQQRFLQHFAFLKKHFNYEGGFIVRSCNNFPQSSGLASSASSFAALTLTAVRSLAELNQQEVPSMADIAALSRVGSGSSCRSLFAPWALWNSEGAHAIELPYPELIHQVILIDHHAKAVSSSDAHQRVTSSQHFEGRPERAEDNLQALLSAFNEKNWRAAYEIVWREFQDMHHLFETSRRCTVNFSSTPQT